MTEGEAPAASEFSRPVPLDRTHTVVGFDCDKPPLNDFLTKYALQNQAGGSARAYVLVSGDIRVLAYYRLGGRAFLVDAKDEEARAFYLRFGMEPSPGDPFRLFLLFKDVKKALGV